MIAEGPALNRPPHIVLEPRVLSSRSLKPVVLGYAVLLAAGALLITACDRQTADPAQPQVSERPAAKGAELAGTLDRTHKGSQLPDFTLKDPSGKELRLQSLKGQPVLINLWATWCAPCVAELPTLDKLAGDGTRVITVSQDMGQPEKVGAFLKSRGLSRIEPWLDPENDLAVQYAVQTLPTTIYYDRTGREVWRFIGGHDWGNAETAKMLAEAE